MVSTFTQNIQLEEPARGDDVGTWDTPVNNNSTLLDLVCGGAATVIVNNSNITLSAAQFQSRMLVFNSTLTGSITITFPTSVTKDYAIWNQATGSSAFTITCKTTIANPTFICPPPGEIVDIYNLGGNIYFKNLERVGTYWDYAGSSVPAWVSGSSPAPYLACTGGTFSSATYPQLAAMIGTTLPDTRGRFRLALDAGVGRVSSGTTGMAANTLFAGGGDQQTQQHSHGVNDPMHSHGVTGGTFGSANLSLNYFQGGSQGGTPAAIAIASAGTGISIQNALGGTAQNIPPAYAAGITMIRAA